jgi:predicted ATP-dependent serine protease
MELNRVLGGGNCPGSMILLGGGEPIGQEYIMFANITNLPYQNFVRIWKKVKSK